ncbi:MAG TPA: YHS domain-containing protein, partial [Nitrosomonas sp.]|nr:YHS domain-containing protein [Nitrosomonas sp.]
MTYEHHKDIQHKHDHHTNHPDIATDPVCGMHVDTSTEKYRAEHDHQVYYFCSAHCHGKFVAAPETYSASKLQTGESTPSAIF